VDCLSLELNWKIVNFGLGIQSIGEEVGFSCLESWCDWRSEIAFTALTESLLAPTIFTVRR